MDYRSTCEINDFLNSTLITVTFIILISAVGQLRLKNKVFHVLKQVKSPQNPGKLKWRKINFIFVTQSHAHLSPLYINVSEDRYSSFVSWFPIFQKVVLGTCYNFAVLDNNYLVWVWISHGLLLAKLVGISHWTWLKERMHL